MSYVLLADVRQAAAALALRPECDIGEAEKIARLTWVRFVTLFQDTFVVECTVCNKRYGECRCEQNGYAHGSGWKYFVENLTVSAAYAIAFHKILNWRISLESLEGLRRSELKVIDAFLTEERMWRLACALMV